jgi:hypothetical protein
MTGILPILLFHSCKHAMTRSWWQESMLNDELGWRICYAMRLMGIKGLWRCHCTGRAFVMLMQ